MEKADPLLAILYIYGGPAVVMILIFFLIAWFMYSREKRRSNKTVYTFYPDRLVYTEAHGSKQFTGTYQNIAGVDLTCTPSQEKKGLGSIYISTWNNSYKIRMNNIANPQDVYYRIKSWISHKSSSQRVSNPWSGDDDFKNVK